MGLIPIVGANVPNYELKEAHSTINKLQKENDKLRCLVAKSNLPCIYCNLAQKDISMCKSGFPGCGRMDDLMLCDDFVDNIP